MYFHDKTVTQTLSQLKTDKNSGLEKNNIILSRKLYGENVFSKTAKKSLINKLLDALKEPMLIILAFGFVLALGTNLGKYFKSGEGDFAECFGVLFAIVLSVSITLIMEGSSEKAFVALGRIYENVAVRVIREGKTILIPQGQVVVGDLVIIESGDKIIADGRLVESLSLMVDESTLTGESLPIKKQASVVLDNSVVLAERVNCVYSGTFVTAGNGLMVVTAVGNKTEIGKIAEELVEETSSSPLQIKLGKLGKTITIVGACCAVLVFILSVIRLYLVKSLNFSSVQELFVSCIVLIIAAVPEGLPTIVAVSLALNMIKLAKENALIKKMTATETAGAVSVICSDKTGTLTQNKMSVINVCKSEYCYQPDNVKEETLWQNFVCNSTADITFENGRKIRKGSSTECALLETYEKNFYPKSYKDYRNEFEIVEREPFSSEKKYMRTTIMIGNKKRVLIKGAPEKILTQCNLTESQMSNILYNISANQKKARRVICFGHVDLEENQSLTKYVYDGFVSICDPIRKEIVKAVQDCKRAGIKVKILTGDNKETAYAIAKELNLCKTEDSVINAQEIENLTDEQLKKVLPSITVIARSTPTTKLRVVKVLKSLGEVVAVTGDGINDAPAIKQADVGIAMGITGSEITKEAADIVLLDDSFSTVVKAISFGRNVYKNLQRFIVFQLSVNVSALLFITTCAILGLETPFNTLQLLWVNIIMDGPPALTLGLENASRSLMENKPIKKEKPIVSKNMFIKIIFNGVFVGGIMILQYLTDFMRVGEQMSGVIFTTFILFHLFNAFNCRELGAQSIFKGIAKNKIMLLTFGTVFLLHIIIVQACANLVSVNALSFISWVKCVGLSFSIVAVSEVYKAFYRIVRAQISKNKKTFVD